MKTTVNGSTDMPFDTMSIIVTAASFSAHDRLRPVSYNTCLSASGFCSVPSIKNQVFQSSVNHNMKGQPIDPSYLRVKSSPDLTPSSSSDVGVMTYKNCYCSEQSVFGTNSIPSFYNSLRRSASPVGSLRTDLGMQPLYQAPESPVPQFGSVPGPKLPSPVCSSGFGQPTVPRPPFILPTIRLSGSGTNRAQSPTIGKEPGFLSLASVGSGVGSRDSHSSRSSSVIWFGRSSSPVSGSGTTFGPSSPPRYGQSPDSGPGPDLGQCPHHLTGSDSQFGQCPTPLNGSGIWFGQPPAPCTTCSQCPAPWKDLEHVLRQSPQPVDSPALDQVPAVLNDSNPQFTQCPAPLNSSGIWFGLPPASAIGPGTKFGEPLTVSWRTDLSGRSAASDPAERTSVNGTERLSGGHKNPRFLGENKAQLLTSITENQSADGEPDILNIPPGTEKKMTAFCHNCGFKYAIPKDIFCCMCGEKRIVPT